MPARRPKRFGRPIRRPGRPKRPNQTSDTSETSETACQQKSVKFDASWRRQLTSTDIQRIFNGSKDKRRWYMMQT